MNLFSQKKIISHFLFSLILLFFFQSCSLFLPTTKKYLDKGYLDLSGETLENPIELQGEVFFYWKKFIKIGSMESPDFYIQLPSVWKEYKINEKELGGKGFGTYRFKIKVSDRIKYLGIRAYDQGTDYEIYINNKLVVSDGVPNGSGDSTAKFLPKTAYFQIDNPELDFIIHISNYNHREGGLWYPILIGDIKTIDSYEKKTFAFGFFQLGGILLIGFYHLFIFLSRHNEKASLVFFWVCIMVIFRIAVNGNRVFLDLFQITGKKVYILDYLSFFMGIPAYVYFAHIVFPKEVSRIFTYVNIFIFFLFSSIVVITPMEFYTEILFLPQALSLIGMFYISVGFIRAYINKREGAIYTLFGCIIFYLACTNDILYARGVVNTGYFLSIGFLFLVLSQSMLLSHRYSKTYLEARMNYEKLQESNTELLSLKNDLEVIVDKRTNELNSTLEKIKKDITTARNIQLGILPKINKNPKLEFSIFFQTMEEVGGDYYDIVELNPNFYRIFLADATGHGIQAGMITMLIKSEYEGLKFLLQGPDQILTTLNLEFYKRFSNLKTYFSCILLDIDLNSNKIYYSSAGHPEQYMVTDGSIKPIYSKGYWVGFSKLFSAKLEVYDFKPGDRLFLFTDGLYEEFNSKQEEFGVERIKKILLNKDLNSIEHVNLKLIDSLSDFLDFKPFQDDITIINIERKKLS